MTHDPMTRAQGSAPPDPHRARSGAADWAEVGWDAAGWAAAGWWSALESELLGGGPIGLNRLIRQGAWRPDDPGAYCGRCGGDAGPHEADDTGCHACRGRRLLWGAAVRLGPYDGPLRGAILGLKYHANRADGRTLGRLMGLALVNRLRSARGGSVIVPVPTTHRRRITRNRGVDHTLVLAREAAGASGVAWAAGLRRHHRPEQSSVVPSKREANVRGVFRIHDQAALLGAERVVLLDDVRTTGATLRSCVRALRAGGVEAEVWVLTAAVAGSGRAGGR